MSPVPQPPQVPTGVTNACTKLDEASAALKTAIDELADSSPWHRRKSNLDLLKEEIVDVRQQLEMLKLQVASGS
jgi:hypothetical protein